jgi:hypothetical protein
MGTHAMCCRAGVASMSVAVPDGLGCLRCRRPPPNAPVTRDIRPKAGTLRTSGPNESQETGGVSFLVGSESRSQKSSIFNALFRVPFESNLVPSESSDEFPGSIGVYPPGQPKAAQQPPSSTSEIAFSFGCWSAEHGRGCQASAELRGVPTDKHSTVIGLIAWGAPNASPHGSRSLLECRPPTLDIGRRLMACRPVGWTPLRIVGFVENNFNSEVICSSQDVISEISFAVIHFYELRVAMGQQAVHQRVACDLLLLTFEAETVVCLRPCANPAIGENSYFPNLLLWSC